MDLKRLISIFCLCFLALSVTNCSKNETKTLPEIQSGDVAVKQTNSPAELHCLQEAYPDHIDSTAENKIFWADGTEMIFDDGESKTFQEMLEQPDLQDQFMIPYPKGENYSLPLPENFDPGRIRYEPFFRKMYGDSREAVRQQLAAVRWLPKTFDKILYVTTVNKVNEKMQAVSHELDLLPDSLKKYLENPGGTFNWRNIAGTDRLSTHSFGITIDINTAYSNYWKWDKVYRYKNRIPIEIVLVFEKHGFIWGGKWYHYDTMHFEYRPELLCRLKRKS